MKLTIENKALAAALKKLQPLTGGASTLPVLACVLLEAKENGAVKLTASNLDVALELEIPCEGIEEAGALAVPCGLLSRVIGGMGSAQVVMEEQPKQRLKLTSGERTALLACIEKGEFPGVPQIKAEAVALPPELGRAIERVLPTVSVDQTRYKLCGVHFRNMEGRLAVTATDGRRAHRMELSDVAGPGEMILPTKAAQMLLGLLAGEPCSAKLETNVCFAGNGWTLTAKVIEGAYPNVEQVIPKDGKGILALPRAEMLNAIAYASVMATEKSVAVKLNVDTQRIEVTASTPDMGEAKATVPIEKGAKQPFAIAFNHAFLAEALKCAPEDPVQVSYQDENSPIKVIGGGFTGVVMPMRIA